MQKIIVSIQSDKQKTEAAISPKKKQQNLETLQTNFDILKKSSMMLSNFDITAVTGIVKNAGFKDRASSLSADASAINLELLSKKLNLFSRKLKLAINEYITEAE